MPIDLPEGWFSCNSPYIALVPETLIVESKTKVTAIAYLGFKTT